MIIHKKYLSCIFRRKIHMLGVYRFLESSNWRTNIYDWEKVRIFCFKFDAVNNNKTYINNKNINNMIYILFFSSSNWKQKIITL